MNFFLISNLILSASVKSAHQELVAKSDITLVWELSRQVKRSSEKVKIHELCTYWYQSNAMDLFDLRAMFIIANAALGLTTHTRSHFKNKYLLRDIM